MTVALHLQQLELINFRCHEQASWSLHQGVNILLGENGCGKTSLLEAASLMAHGRSFRQGRDPALVRWDCAAFTVRGVWHRYGPLHIQLQGKRNQLQAFLQGQRVAIRKELTEVLPLVVDAPQARSLIDGVTADRRRWLDQLLIAYEPSTQQPRRAYLRVLMQRGRLLRHQASAAELDVWEIELAQYGQLWSTARARLCQA
ncbi:MAG: AAA family ATPase [Mariprofundaceae bacterium]|nr:AAA family ATPase [Mariprofundaceae bacterium]